MISLDYKDKKTVRIEKINFPNFVTKKISSIFALG